MNNWTLLCFEPTAPLLDPPTRAVLLMSLLAFVLLGGGLIAGAILGGRWARQAGSADLTKPLPLNRLKTLGDRANSPKFAGQAPSLSGDTSASDRGSVETLVG